LVRVTFLFLAVTNDDADGLTIRGFQSANDKPVNFGGTIMLTMMREGGHSMFVLLVFGLALLVTAAGFAIRPGRRRLKVAVALAIGTACSTVTGVSSDLAAVGHKAPEFLQEHAGTTLPFVLLQGFAESMAPLILGSTILAAAALLVALGLYRQKEV
jgi:hypothetical protein